MKKWWNGLTGEQEAWVGNQIFCTLFVAAYKGILWGIAGTIGVTIFTSVAAHVWGEK